LAKNKVVAGDYNGKRILVTLGTPAIQLSVISKLSLDRATIDSYEVVSTDQRKSAISGIVRGLIGNALLGQAGMVGGTLSAKNNKSFLLAVEFRDGKRSLLEINDKIYQSIIKSTF